MALCVRRDDAAFQHSSPCLLPWFASLALAMTVIGESFFKMDHKQYPRRPGPEPGPQRERSCAHR